MNTIRVSSNSHTHLSNKWSEMKMSLSIESQRSIRNRRLAIAVFTRHRIYTYKQQIQKKKNRNSNILFMEKLVSSTAARKTLVQEEGCCQEMGVFFGKWVLDMAELGRFLAKIGFCFCCLSQIKTF